MVQPRRFCLTVTNSQGIPLIYDTTLNWILDLLIIAVLAIWLGTRPVIVAAACSVTTAATSSASTFQFTRQLAVGSSGTDVKQLQTILATQGFFKYTVTGYFGSITKQAVMAYQKKMV